MDKTSPNLQSVRSDVSDIQKRHHPSGFSLWRFFRSGKSVRVNSNVTVCIPNISVGFDGGITLPSIGLTPLNVCHGDELSTGRTCGCVVLQNGEIGVSFFAASLGASPTPLRHVQSCPACCVWRDGSMMLSMLSMLSMLWKLWLLFLLLSMCLKPKSESCWRISSCYCDFDLFLGSALGGRPFEHFPWNPIHGSSVPVGFCTSVLLR